MILILGKSGYVSKRFQEFFTKLSVPFEVQSLRCNDLTVDEVIDSGNYTFVINCIAYTGKPNIDECEFNKYLTLRLNSLLPLTIGIACDKRKIPMAHISTGCVYNGYKEGGWLEDIDEPTASFITNYKCSWYAASKSFGEHLVGDSVPMHYIWRLRMPFNNVDEDKNLLSKFLKYGNILDVPNSITNLDEFVYNCYMAYIMKVPYGIYNMVNTDPIVPSKILDIAKECGIEIGEKNFQYSIEEFDKMQKTPRSNCILSTEKIERVGITFLSTTDSVRKCFTNWNNRDLYPFWN